MGLKNPKKDRVVKEEKTEETTNKTRGKEVKRGEESMTPKTNI